MSAFEMNSSVFAQQSFKYERTMITTDVFNFDKPFHFGVLNLTAVENSVLQEKSRDFIITCDNSASMEDVCSDGKTKFQHSQHTVKNMVRYICKNVPSSYITIYSFNDKMVCVVERTALTVENMTSILEKIDTVYPDGATNIEKALEKVHASIDLIKKMAPENEICHVFMTDGDVTRGSDNASILSQLVDITVFNAFIGYGKDHNSQLLSAIAEKGKQHSYRFIDAIENAGIVYGEILNEFLYKILTNVELTVTNGYVYDYKTDTWVQSLEIDNIVSEGQKTYHIISADDPDTCTVQLIGQNMTGETECFWFASPTQVEELDPYIFRQRAMQLMYRCKQLFLERKMFSYKNVDKYNFGAQPPKDNVTPLKKSLREFLKEMKDYMKEMGLTKDNFMRNLCDDIYVCFNTLTSENGDMFITSRHSSQGSQRAYSAKYDPAEYREEYAPVELCFQRTATGYCGVSDNSASLVQDELGETGQAHEYDPLIDHQLSDFASAPYKTPRATSIMRDLSIGVTSSDVFYIEKDSMDGEYGSDVEIEKY